MKQIDILLEKYGESHMNPVNKFIHWVCVPLIMFSFLMLLFSIPFFVERTFFANWAMVVLVLAWIYYARLSLLMFFGFVVIGSLMLWGIYVIYGLVDFHIGKLVVIGLVIFIVAWIAQLVGHKIEGKKPSFFDDLRFLLIGPAWLMSFILKKMGITY